MKKTLSVLLAVLFIFSAIPATGVADLVKNADFTFLAVKSNAASTSDLTFALNDDGKSYYVSDCNQDASFSLAIPSTYNGKSVTGIGEDAFCYCKSLTSITIPDSVKSIGNGAFYDCINLTTITIPDSIMSIGSEAFSHCKSLTSITIPDSVKSIGNNAFYDCINLISVTIPGSVTSIGKEAFFDCNSLTSVTIPDSVTSIGDSAFYNTAFYNNLSNRENGVLYIGNHLIDAKPDISGSYTIKSGTKCIADYAFDGCKNLLSVTIPDSVTSIGNRAFENCDILASITIGNSVTSIGDCAFYYCFNLTTVTIPDSVKSIGNQAFENCDILASITIGNSVTSIGNEAFSHCKSLTSITIPDSVKSIGNDAFYDCINLISVTISDSVMSIGGNAFYNTAYYNNSSNWENGVLYIGNHTIGVTEGKNDITGSYTIKSGTKCIADYAFDGCKNLLSVTIPDSVTSIGNRAFSGCNILASVTIGNSVMSIGEGVFYGCSNLNSVIIPDSVTSIGNGAFSNCKSLTSITIPDSVTSMGTNVFENCVLLASITIGNSVTSIGDCAFYYCFSLTTVIIPDSVKNIGNDAFYDCERLTSVTIGNNLTSIGEEAFCCCFSLKTVTIPNSVTNIGDWAFSDCRSLKSVTIGNSVTSIGHHAFWDCDALMSVTIPDSVISIGVWAFYNSRGLTIYGKTGSEAERYAKQFKIPFKPSVVKPSTPSLSKAENTTTGVKITWSAVDGAENYIVYRKSDSSGYEPIKTVSGSTTSYTDTTAKSGTKYTYTVQATNASGKGEYDKTGLSKLYLATPTVKTSNTSKGVSVKWNKITGAKGYYVYRKAGSGSWTKVKEITSGSTVSFTDTNVKSGTKYSYYVKAYNGKTVSGYKASTALLYLATPTVKISNTSKGVSVKWNKITGAKGYYVYRKAGSGKWTKVKEITSGSTVSYTDTNVKSGTKYSYYVKAYNGKTVSSYKASTTLMYLSAVKLSSATSGKSGITVKWSKVSGAKGYYVYRKAGSGSFKKLATVKSGSTVKYLDKSAKKGTTYTYYVKAYNGSYTGSYANTLKCKDKY